ncbi:FAD-dependent oxidoreductase [Microlunatus aurantiacus]|uniref:FAD-dependent oxidoreductase n=1 Tax=Microlunatus aurantiacus TaxID=446786 RepID=A0ABP7CJ61_9ACTN
MRSSLLVVGAGLAGLGAARAARQAGFTGSVTVVGAETHRPYDRPPLSKDYLLGTVGVGDIGLEGSTEDLQVDWRLGSVATAFEAGRRRLSLADGSTLDADAVVLATGSTARQLPGVAGPNVATLRTLDDADRLRSLLRPGVAVAIVGAGLIGSELASAALTLGCRVTLLSNETNPLGRLYGDELGQVFLDWHREHGAEFVHCTSVTGIGGSDGVRELVVGTAAGERRVRADVVVVSVGGAPDVDWLAGSGLTVVDGVVCDERGLTSAAGVGAVGDCASWWDPRLGRHHRAQHWTDALERPAIVVSALLGVPLGRARPYLPYFWSDQYGRRIQLAGYPTLADRIEVDGDVADPAAGFVAHYRRDGESVAILSVGRPREFTRARKQLTAELGHLPVELIRAP